MALTYGIGIIPWSPTANGLLAGRFRRGEPVPEGARFKPGDARLTNRRMLEDATFDAIDAVAKLASEKGCKLVELAVAWLASRPGCNGSDHRPPDHGSSGKLSGRARR